MFSRPEKSSIHSINPFLSSQEKKQDLDTTEIKPGTKIEHKIFGQGTVISIKGTGENAEVTIAFDSKGIKKLVLGYAPLKVIN